jgi:LPXTG-motif cell wall-anchored protein
MKRTWKAVAIGAITAVAGIGVGTVGTEIALAHNASASANCENGVTLSVSNYAGSPTVNTVTVKIDGSVVLTHNFGSESYSTTVANPNKFVTHTWQVHVNQGDGNSFDLDFPGPNGNATPGNIPACRVNPTAPTITTSAVCGVKDRVTVIATANVTYNPVPGFYDLIEGQVQNVTATANAGYSFPAGTTTSWHFVGGKVEVCATPTAPTITTSSVCSVKDKVTITATANVTYNPVPGTYDLIEGQVLNVTATANAGFAFPAGTTASWSFTGGHVEVCATPVAPTVTVTTVCGVKDTFSAGPTTGILYSIDGITYTATVTGSLNAGNNVGVVKAKADAGYVLSPAAQTSFDLVGSPIEQCGLPVGPTVMTTSDCGVMDTFTAGPTVGVIYTPSSGTLAAGQTVVIVATPDTANGYNFPTVTFQVAGGPVEVCPTTVTPVAPKVTSPSDCGVGDSYTTVPVTGIVYSSVSGTLGQGEVVVITATAEPGYVIAEGVSSTFTLTGGTIEICPEETSTTVQQVQVEPPAVTAPPAPDAPVTGLPETGSSNSMTLLFGGFALIAGAAMLAAVRRRSVK